MVKKILIVDDSKSMRSLITTTLKSAGFEVQEAEDGIYAIESFKSFRPNLVLTDINMPRMGGLELISEIRKIDSIVPILCLTTESSEGMKKTGKSNGATGWIVKPFSPEKLLSTIERVLY